MNCVPSASVHESVVDEAVGFRASGGMAHGRDTIIEGILRASEDLLVSCLLENRGNLPIAFEEIPEDERRPEFPMRYRLALASSARRLTLTRNTSVG